MPSTIVISAAPTPEAETFRQSAAYSVAGEVASRLVSLGVFVLLARLLSPREFGLLAMITVISGFFAVMIELGFTQALIHYPDLDDELHSTALAINALAGATVAIGALLGAEWIAGFYGQVGLVDMLKLVSVVFVLNPISSIQAAILQKSRRFRPVAAIEMAAVLAGAAVALVLAWRGSGAWALVWNLVAVAAVRAVLYSVLAPRPKPRFAWAAAAKLWRYGRYVLLTNAFNYAALNLDQFLIGRFLGPALLGAYRYAGQLVAIPQTFCARTLNSLLLSWYSEKQGEPETVKATHLRVFQVLSFYTLPVMMVAIVVADCLVLSILGRRWEVLIVVIRFMAVVEMIQVLGAVNGPLILSQGRTWQLFMIGLLRINPILGVLAGLPFGLNGVLWGALIARLVNFYPSMHFGVRSIGLGFLEVMRRIGMSALIAAAASGVLLVLKLAAAPDPESIGALLALTAGGMLLYGSLSYLFNRRVLIEGLRTAGLGFAR